ncbi:MAG: hypothetical protein LBQ11_02350 [Candidatus Nomurabacteria bacterium]|nr:hypothetical protein [Candidatus Nomurabacteria bacterium]
MKRTIEDLVDFYEKGGELEQLNFFGHVKATNKQDKRPGCERDKEAGLKLTRLQKIQERMGWATVANLMSVYRPITAGIGIGLFASGEYVIGGWLLAYAAASDAEGNVARATGTDDPNFGAKIDAICDFIAAFFVSAGVIASDIMPILALAGVYGPKILNAFNAGVAERDNIEQHTDKVDKAVEAARWVTLILFLINYAASGDCIDPTILNGTAAVVAIGGIISTCRQFKRTASARRQKKN